MAKEQLDLILAYGEELPEGCKEVLFSLARVIDEELKQAELRRFHGSPVWFIQDNPIVGLSQKKGMIQLLFWSGQSFPTPGLIPCGKHKAAEFLYGAVASKADQEILKKWLQESQTYIWNYKDIRKNNGTLEWIGN